MEDAMPISTEVTTTHWAPPKIEDHALIGNMHTAALVTKGGVMDWLCMPDFDSDACFASILGTGRNGLWSIAPTEPITEIRRRYRPDTVLLETEFVTSSGKVKLIDFIPPCSCGKGE